MPVCDIVNFDLPEAGKQGELYFGRQKTSAKLDNGLFAHGTQAIDVTIYRRQFGGLYFPGGKSYGGFASGALMLGSYRYKSIESILKHRLDQQPLEEQQELALPDTHDNIRGPAYYH